MYIYTISCYFVRHAGMKVATIAEKMNNPIFFLQCLQTSYPMKHFIAYIYILKLIMLFLKNEQNSLLFRLFLLSVSSYM